MTKEIFFKHSFFNLDMLEFNVWNIKEDFIFFKELNPIDIDNTSRASIIIDNLKFSYEKINISGYSYWYKFSVVFFDEIVDCFAIFLWKEIKNFKKKSKDKVVFYSSFFNFWIINHLPDLVKNFYTNNFINKKKHKLHRLDIALDFPFSMDFLQKKLNKKNYFSKIWKNKTTKNYETYYTREKQSSKNPYFLFRIYDKKLDTFRKGKWFLFKHLQKNTTRIELELRKKECERLSSYDIIDFFDFSLFSLIFFKYFEKDFWKLNFDYKKFIILPYKNNKKEETQKNDINIIPIDYLNRSLWYFKKIKNMCGYEWLCQLITESLIEYDEINEKKIKIKTNYYGSLNFLDTYIKYLKNNWLHKSLIKKILKKNLTL